MTEAYTRTDTRTHTDIDAVTVLYLDPFISKQSDGIVATPRMSTNTRRHTHTHTHGETNGVTMVLISGTSGDESELRRKALSSSPLQ